MEPLTPEYLDNCPFTIGGNNGRKRVNHIFKLIEEVFVNEGYWLLLSNTNIRRPVLEYPNHRIGTCLFYSGTIAGKMVDDQPNFKTPHWDYGKGFPQYFLWTPDGEIKKVLDDHYLKSRLVG